MDHTCSPASDPVTHTRYAETSRQIRGSSLLLLGRMCSLVINFATQVLIVRYLSKTEYGIFAYALSIVTMGESIAKCGLDRTLSRFVPIYHEKGEYSKLFGTLVLVLGVVLCLGFAVVLVAYGFQAPIAQRLVHDPQALALVLILVVLVPVQAFDAIVVSMFAIFASARSILLRKHVLQPGLQLTVVLLLIWWKRDVFFLATGYLASVLLGVGIYTTVLLRMLRNQGLFQHFHLPTLKLPVRDVFTFTFPVLTHDLVFVLMSTVAVVLLGHFRNAAEVAAFRAVEPAARLNQLAHGMFAYLYTPLASRLFARNDQKGISNLYWQSTIWIAVLSFPIFAVSFSLAQPLTLMLFGQPYADSAPVLALCALGCYFNAALGHNWQTLLVFGKTRYIVVVNILVASVSLGVNLLLIPRYGALGAAIGICGMMVAQNLLIQAGLRLGTGIALFPRRYLKVYLSIMLCALGLLLIQRVTSAPIYLGLVLTAFASLFIARLNRRTLDAGHTFPELSRLPLVRRLFSE